MKVHFLPAEQSRLNDTAIVKLRRLGYILTFVILATVVLGAGIYVWPPSVRSGPQLFGPDGTLYGDAILLGPDLLLCGGRMSNSAEFVGGGERIAATKVNSAEITDGTEMNLLRLEHASSLPPLVPAVGEENDQVVAMSARQEWQATIRSIKRGLYELDPQPGAAAGTPVVRKADRSALVGVTAQSHGAAVIVPSKDVIGKFPELNRR